MSELSTAQLDQIALRPRGPRREIALPPAYARDLGEGDLKAIAEGKPAGEPKHVVLSEVKAKHHTIAMMLAAGAALARVSFVTGYAVGTIKQIQLSPLFQDLLAYYVEQKEHEFKDFYAKAAQLGMDAVEELHKRLAEAPGDIKTRELLEIAEKMLERTILPAKAKEPEWHPPSAPAVTVIQFIDSPHSGAAVLPPPPKGEIIEAQGRTGGRMLEIASR